MTDSAEAPNAQRAGRGALLLSGAHAVTIAAGFFLHLGLARMLGAEDYGRYGFAISVLVWFEMACTHGLPYAASLRVAGAPQSARAVGRGGVLATLVLGVPLTLALVAAAPLVAGVVDDTPQRTLLAWAALDILPFGLLNLRLMLLNGLHRYGAQAALYSSYIIARMALALGAVALGFGVAGAVVANAAASALLALVATRVALQGALGERRDEATALLRDAAPMSAFHLAGHAFLFVDVWCLSALRSAEADLGYYFAAQAVARAPYGVAIGVALALFPVVRSALAEGDRATAAAHIRDALARQVTLLLPACGLLLAGAEPTVRVLFGDAYAPAAPALRLLAIASVAAALMQTLAHALSGAASPKRAGAALALSALTAGAVSGALLWRGFPFWVAACGPVAGAALCALGLGFGFRRALGLRLPMAAALRGLVAGGLLYLAAWLPGFKGLPALAWLSVLGAGWLAAAFKLGLLRAQRS